jgi:hypothetical protein
MSMISLSLDMLVNVSQPCTAGRNRSAQGQPGNRRQVLGSRRGKAKRMKEEKEKEERGGETRQKATKTSAPLKGAVVSGKGSSRPVPSTSPSASRLGGWANR